MKKVIYALILPLALAGGLVFANREAKPDNPELATSKPLPAAEKESAMKQWEATPEGIKYKKWEASPIGQKVLAGAALIRKYVRDSSSVDAVVTSLSLPPGSRLGFGIMARINGVDYIVTFEPEQSQLAQLRTLEVGDNIIITCHGVSHAPKYSYAIITSDYVGKDSKVIFRRVPRTGGC